MNTKPMQLSTPTDTTIVITRTFNAPRRLVWAAFFSPDKMMRWMIPPPKWTTKSLECDARLGGKLKIVWKSAEADPAMTLHGEFTEVAAPERAVHTENMVLGNGQSIGSLVETHEFTEQGGVTTLRITQVYPSKEDRDGAIASGMDQGMEACYQNLDTLLAQPA